jgi:hypothetical protein
MGCAATVPQNLANGLLFMQSLLQHHRYIVLKMNVNGASMTLRLVSCRILRLCGDSNVSADYLLPV